VVGIREVDLAAVEVVAVAVGKAKVAIGRHALCEASVRVGHTIAVVVRCPAGFSAYPGAGGIIRGIHSASDRCIEPGLLEAEPPAVSQCERESRRE
jgi:hypothetical protein